MKFLENGLKNLGVSLPEDFEFNNTFFRFGRKKAYSLIGHEFNSYNKQHVLKTATFFDWTGKIPTTTFKSWKDSILYPKDRKKILKIKAEIKEQSKKNHSNFFYEQENASESHSYLKQKSIDLNLHGFQKDYPIKQIDKTLLIPMIDIRNKELNGIEKITENSSKYREKGSVGNFSIFPFTTKATKNVLLTEGFADGFNLWECSNLETYTLFGQKNFDYIVPYLAKSQLNKRFFIMADEATPPQLKHLSMIKNETITPEMYRKSIYEKWEKYLNVFVLFCGDQGSVNPDGSCNIKDFNDFYLYDFEKAKRWLESKITDTPNLFLLGNSENKIYIYSTRNKEVKEIKENSTQPALNLLAEKKFWNRKFPGKGHKAIINSLFEKSADKNYDPSKIRRGGVYFDNNNFIINDGEGNITGDYSSDYIYLPINKFDYDPQPKLSEETKVFLNQIEDNYFAKQAYEDKLDGYFILAWAILSILSPALKIRFSIGLFGDSSTGKTETYKNLIYPLLLNYKNKHKSVMPTTTFASFKRSLIAGYCSFCLSEAEGKNYTYNFWKFLRASIDAMEESSEQVGGGGKIIKIPNDLMLMTTYNNQPDIEEPDLNRIIEIDFKHIKLDNKKFQDSLLFLNGFKLNEIGKNLIDYTIYNFENLRKRIAEYAMSEFGMELVGHKKRAGHLISSFYENLNFYPEKKITKIKKRFVEHTENKSRESSKYGNLQALANLSIWIQKEPLTLIQLLRKMPESDGDLASENWNLHYKEFWRGFQDRFEIRMIEKKWVFSLAIPRTPTLSRDLILLGIKENETNIFSLANKEWGLNGTVRMGHKTIHCMVVPITFFLKEKTFERKRSFLRKNKKYFNEFS